MSLEPRARLWRFLRKAVRLCLIAVASVYLLYLVALNVFLSTPLFGIVANGNPQTIDVHFERGWSLWPGRVHARGLSIRGRDSSVEWMLRIRQVQFDVSFRALARQTFLASNVRGTGGSFRLRTRINGWEATPKRLAGLPPIEGLRAEPIRPYQQCSANEWSDADYHLWTVQLEGVHADDVQEIWIDRYRLDGDTSATGRFYLKPIRETEVGPLRADLRPSRLSVDGLSWAEGLEGRADFTMPRFDPRLVDGLGLLRLVKIDTELRGVWPDVGRLPVPMPEGATLHGAFDVRRLAVQVDGGRFRPGSELDVKAPEVVLDGGEHRLASALAVEGHVEPDGERLSFHALAGGARLTRAGDPVLVSQRLEVTGDARTPDVDHGVEGLHLTAESAAVQVPDIAALGPYLPSDAHVTLAGGRAQVGFRFESWPEEARVTGRAGLWAGDVDVRAGRVHARGGGALADASFASFDWRTGRVERPEASLNVGARLEVAASEPVAPPAFEGDVRAVVLARKFDPDERSLDVSGSGVALRNVALSGTPATDSRGDVTLLQGATVRLEDRELQGVVTADVVDATPLLGTVRDRVPGPFRGLLDIPLLRASARVTMAAHRVRLDDVEARGGRLAVNGVFAARGRRHLGAFVVRGAPVSVGVRLDANGARLRLFGLSGWLEDQEEAAGRLGKP